jgi:hypothetical protein
MEEDDGVKALGGRIASQLEENRFNKAVKKVDIVLVFNKYFKQINTERPSGVPYTLHKALSCERYQEFEGKPPSGFLKGVLKLFTRMPSTILSIVKSPSLGCSDDEAAPSGPTTDRNRFTGVMGQTLDGPQQQRRK